MPRVTVNPSGHTFVAEGNDNLLDAALGSGLALDYGCSNGNCGLCKARLVSGTVERVRHQDFVLPAAEKSTGTILLCANAARSDLTLEAQVAGGAGDIPRQTVAARLKRIARLGDRVAVLHVQTSRTRRLRFMAGQNAILHWPDGPGVELPIASCPCDDRNLEFHVRATARDPFTTRALADASRGALLTVQGPTGTVVLDEGSQRPVIFLTWDTGFAPVKALIEHALSTERRPHIALWWLVPANDGPYMHNLVRSWEDAFDTFHYHPISVGDAPPDRAFEHPQLHRALADDPRWPESDLCAAGPSAFVRAARLLATQRGVPGDQWFDTTLK